MKNRIRIILADDHSVLRVGLKMLLESESHFSVVGEAADGEELLILLEKTAVDVVVVDLSMPKMGGLECIKEIRSRGMDVKILVLTMFGDETYIREVMQAGANGYVEKQAVDAELFAALKAVAAGQFYLSSKNSQALLNSLFTAAPRPSGQDPYEVLSVREREVLKLLVRGYSLSEIGAKLFLSVKTVDTYKTRLMEKLGLSKKSELVEYSLKHGLLSTKDI
ncbi:MAG: response regulator transcription factor [Anaeromusa sp.]|jgi:two-component system response regulator NreC|uniref:response regulator n=1 Tax=Anaeromusa sp. TaxID=1872520 RepID=UPI002623166A|nr:response regulator transcription factor [Anaeromusa sp.]MDD3157727.1 response regulator transcription factor [Anaeromusa sp.]MEA4836066.1 response regulator transcription factor [Anaeromusa sp.]